MTAKLPLKQTSGVKFLPWKFDTRVVARNVDAGIILPNELEAHFKALADSAAKGEPFHTPRPGEQAADDDDDLDDEG